MLWCASRTMVAAATPGVDIHGHPATGISARPDTARSARHCDCALDDRGHDGGRLSAGELSRNPPRIGDLPDPGPAGRLASRPAAVAGRGGGRRPVLGLPLLFSLLQILLHAADRDPQSLPV